MNARRFCVLRGQEVVLEDRAIRTLEHAGAGRTCGVEIPRFDRCGLRDAPGQLSGGDDRSRPAPTHCARRCGNAAYSIRSSHEQSCQ